MSIRSIWIVSASIADDAKLLFVRNFPTVEKRSRLLDGERHVPVPIGPVLVDALCSELGLTGKTDEFVESRDSCHKKSQKPVFEISTAVGKLWPVIVVEQLGYLYCCVTLVEQGAFSRPPLIEIPSVSLGFTLLCDVADFMGSLPASTDESSPKLQDLCLFLSEAMPFGKPRDINPASVTAKMSNKPTILSKTQKQPSWKPILHKGKSQISVMVSEQIRGVQYARENLRDLWDVYGTITCKAELEGAQTDITLNVSHVADSLGIPIDHLLIHPCVQTAEASTADAASRASPRRLRFVPPLESFTLCHYTVSALQDLPFKGHYQMKMIGERTANVEIRLWLHEKVKNTFDYCELQMPFFNRGVIVNHEVASSCGNILLSPDRRILVWSIGQRFPGKSLEASLSGTVHFGETGKTNFYEDEFCIGQNCYANLFFRISDFTHTGCYVDPKSIQVSPSTKYKLTTGREYISSEYKIWNTLGDVLATLPLSNLTSS